MTIWDHLGPFRTIWDHFGIVLYIYQHVFWKSLKTNLVFNVFFFFLIGFATIVWRMIHLFVASSFCNDFISDPHEGLKLLLLVLKEIQEDQRVMQSNKKTKNADIKQNLVSTCNKKQKNGHIKQNLVRNWKKKTTNNTANIMVHCYFWFGCILCLSAIKWMWITQSYFVKGSCKVNDL